MNTGQITRRAFARKISRVITRTMQDARFRQPVAALVPQAAGRMRAVGGAVPAALPLARHKADAGTAE